MDKKFIHVYPVNDIKEHDPEGTQCPCCPEVDWIDMIVTHNAFDCREVTEEAEKIMREFEENDG